MSCREDIDFATLAKDLELIVRLLLPLSNAAMVAGCSGNRVPL